MEYSFENFPGMMPIRVLQYNLLHDFTNLNPDFAEYSKSMIKDGRIKADIRLDCTESQVQSPMAGSDDHIYINEAFLTYMWCCCYGIAIIHSEQNQKMHDNYQSGSEVSVIDMDVVRKAFKVFEYGQSLLKGYSKWDKTLPNPETLDPKIQVLTEKANGLHLAAMKYVLAHEFAHIELNHSTRSTPGMSSLEQSTVFEREADARAIELVLQGQNDHNKDTIRFGILIGLCSLLFFSSSTIVPGYPNTDDRIEIYLKEINPSPLDPMWALTVLAYKLWDQFNGIGLKFEEGLESQKELYHSIKLQIEQRNKAV